MTQASHPGIYDSIGHGYRARRVPDPRIAARIHAALGDAHSVCNVGAGTGSYEPRDRTVVAVEPSRAMLAQRSGGNVVRGIAEALPFRDGSFDAAMALLTVHHWLDAHAGLAELVRIAPRRVVFGFDLGIQHEFWLVREYLPTVVSFDKTRTPSVAQIADALGASRIESLPIPWDCSDGFMAAYWRRPECYLDPAVRASISSLAQLPQHEIEPGLRRLAADLDSGAWARRHADLLAREEMDHGYRLIVS